MANTYTLGRFDAKTELKRFVPILILFLFLFLMFRFQVLIFQLYSSIGIPAQYYGMALVITGLFFSFIYGVVQKRNTSKENVAQLTIDDQYLHIMIENKTPEVIDKSQVTSLSFSQYTMTTWSLSYNKVKAGDILKIRRQSGDPISLFIAKQEDTEQIKKDLEAYGYPNVRNAF